MRTLPAFQRWLEEKLDWLNAVEDFDEFAWAEAHAAVVQARDFAVQLRLPTAAAAARKGPPRLRLLEVFDAVADKPEFLTIQQVVAMLGISEKSVRRRVDDCTLPTPVKIGRASRWRRLDIENYGINLQKKSKRKTDLPLLH
jgi:predicted DNA-binding transcriptional regulator AlpA